MKRLSVFTLIATLCLAVSKVSAEDADQRQNKEALKALQEFIGGWKGSGAPLRTQPGATRFWNETLDWSWRFKGNDVWLSLDIKDGKYYKRGELRYVPKKKAYQFTAIDAMDKKQVFEGEYKNNYLVLEREDQDKKETQKITMNIAGDGVRFIYRFEHKPAGRTVFIRDYMVASTKLGESLGATKKQNECVVTGGLGTTAVSFKGETFYVCCSGCRDAFNENPEKYIAEYKARKTGKK